VAPPPRRCTLPHRGWLRSFLTFPFFFFFTLVCLQIDGQTVLPDGVDCKLDFNLVEVELRGAGRPVGTVRFEPAFCGWLFLPFYFLYFPDPSSFCCKWGGGGGLGELRFFPSDTDKLAHLVFPPTPFKLAPWRYFGQRPFWGVRSIFHPSPLESQWRGFYCFCVIYPREMI